MKMKKLVAMLLAAMMLISVAGCGKAEEPATQDKTQETTPETTQKEETTTTTPAEEETPAEDEGSDLPEGYTVLTDENGEVYDLGGAEIIIRNWWSSGEWEEPKNDYDEARLEYIEWIQDTYNFTINELGISTWESAAEDYLNYATSGGDEYYIFTLSQENAGGAIVSAMKSGLMYDLTTLDCLDFTDDKWNKGIMELGSIGDSVYSFSAVKPEPRGGIYFNKRLLKEAGIDPESIYQLQEDMEWTWEKFEELCQQIHQDTDNDGVIDRYASVLDATSMFCEAVYSNNTGFIGRDENGNFVNLLESGPTMDALNWALDMMEKYRYMPEGAEWDYWKTAFVSGQGAFIAGDAYLANNEFKDMEDEFGFVCFPMGPNATDYANVTVDNVYVIPGCYDAEKAWTIAFAYDLFSAPVPGYEDYDGAEVAFLEQFRDIESVELTINRMWDNAKVAYHNMVPGLKYGEQFVWNIGSWNLPAVQAEAIRGEWQGYLDAANGK